MTAFPHRECCEDQLKIPDSIVDGDGKRSPIPMIETH